MTLFAATNVFMGMKSRHFLNVAITSVHLCMLYEERITNDNFSFMRSLLNTDIQYFITFIRYPVTSMLTYSATKTFTSPLIPWIRSLYS